MFDIKTFPCHDNDDNLICSLCYRLIIINYMMGRIKFFILFLQQASLEFNGFQHKKNLLQNINNFKISPGYGGDSQRQEESRGQDEDQGVLPQQPPVHGD